MGMVTAGILQRRDCRRPALNAGTVALVVQIAVAYHRAGRMLIIPFNTDAISGRISKRSTANASFLIWRRDGPALAASPETSVVAAIG